MKFVSPSPTRRSRDFTDPDLARHYPTRHPDDTPAWPIAASLLAEWCARFFRVLLPTALLGFLILLAAWLAI